MERCSATVELQVQLMKGAVNASCHFKSYWVTPLRIAAYCGKSEVATTLLKNGASVNATTSCLHYSPLHGACMAGRAEGAKILLQNGSDVNSTDLVERNPLSYLQFKTPAPNMYKILLEVGADLLQ